MEYEYNMVDGRGLCKCAIVYPSGRFDESYPKNLAKFAVWVSEQIKSIPEEYRGSAKIEAEGFASYDGCADGDLKIYYPVETHEDEY